VVGTHSVGLGTSCTHTRTHIYVIYLPARPYNIVTAAVATRQRGETRALDDTTWPPHERIAHAPNTVIIILYYIHIVILLYIREHAAHLITITTVYDDDNNIIIIIIIN